MNPLDDDCRRAWLQSIADVAILQRHSIEGNTKAINSTTKNYLFKQLILTLTLTVTLTLTLTPDPNPNHTLTLKTQDTPSTTETPLRKCM